MGVKTGEYPQEGIKDHFQHGKLNYAQLVIMNSFTGSQSVFCLSI